MNQQNHPSDRKTQARKPLELSAIEQLAKQRVQLFYPLQKDLIDYYLNQLAANGELRALLEDKPENSTPDDDNDFPF